MTHASPPVSGFKASPASPLASQGRGGRRGRPTTAPSGLAPPPNSAPLPFRTAPPQAPVTPPRSWRGTPASPPRPDPAPIGEWAPGGRAPLVTVPSPPRGAAAPVRPDPVLHLPPPFPPGSLTCRSLVSCLAEAAGGRTGPAGREGEAGASGASSAQPAAPTSFVGFSRPLRWLPQPQVDGRRAPPAIGCRRWRGGAAAPPLGGRARGGAGARAGLREGLGAPRRRRPVGLRPRQAEPKPAVGDRSRRPFVTTRGNGE